MATDITKQGPLTYRELQEENEKNYYKQIYEADLLVYQDLLSGKYNDSRTNGILTGRYAPQENYDISETLRDSDFGKSKYDKNINSFKSQLSELNELRSLHQTRWSKLGNSLVNASVIAATTVLDGWGGIPVGIIQALGTAAKGGNMAEIRAAYTGNIWSSFLLNIQEEFSLPVYQSKYYQNSSIWDKATSVNFWTDSVIKNAGFMVGAYFSGKGISQVLSKAAKLDKALDMFKGAAVSAGVGDKTDDALMLFQRYAKGDLSITSKQVEEALQQTAKTVKNRRLGVRIASQAIASDGEARLESIGSAKQYYESLDQVALGVLQKGTSDEYLTQKIFDEHPEWFDIQTVSPETPGMYQMKVPKINQNYILQFESLKEQYKAEAQLKYQEYQDQLKNDYNDYLNTVYTANLAVLLTTNGNVIGDLGLGGFSKASKLVSYGKKAGKSADGVALAGMNKLKTSKEFVKSFSSPLSEMFQESTQSSITAAADKYYGLRINNYYEQALYSEGLRAHSSFVYELASSMWNTATNPENWEEGLTGFFSAFLPMGGRINRTKTKDGKTKRELLLNGGFWEDRREFKQSKKDAQKYIKAYNDFANNPEKRKLFNAAIRDKYYRDRKELALQQLDKNEYKNTEFDLLINSAMLYVSNGRGQTFKEMLDNLYSIESEQDIEDLKSITMTEDGKSIFDGMSNDEIKDYYRKTKKELFSTIDRVGTTLENLNLIWGNSTSEEFRLELAYNILNIDNRESRIKDLVNNIKNNIISKNREFLENSGVDMSLIDTALSNLQNMSILYEKGSLEDIDKEIQKGRIKSLESKRLDQYSGRSNTYMEATKLELEEELKKAESENNTEDIETLKGYLNQIHHIQSKNRSIPWLKSRISYLQNKINKLLLNNQDSKNDYEIRNLQNKLYYVENEYKERLKGIDGIITAIDSLKKAYGNNPIFNAELSSKDLDDLIKLLQQRQLFIEQFESLSNNPLKFENNLYKSFAKAYTECMNRNLKRYIDAFIKSKNPQSIPEEYLDEVHDFIKNLSKLDTLIQPYDYILLLYKKYKKLIENFNEKKEAVSKETANTLINAISLQLSKATGISLTDINLKIKEFLTVINDLFEKETIESNDSKLIKYLLKNADAGLSSAKTNKNKEEKTKKEKRPSDNDMFDDDSTTDDEEDSEDLDTEEEDSTTKKTPTKKSKKNKKIIQTENKKNVKDSKGDDEVETSDEDSTLENEEDEDEVTMTTEDSSIEDGTETKPRKLSTEKSEEELEEPFKKAKNKKEDKKDEDSDVIKVSKQKNPLKPRKKASEYNTEEETDEIVNPTAGYYSSGESNTSGVDDYTIDAIHVGRKFTKYSIPKLLQRIKSELKLSGLSLWLEDYGAYKFVEEGGLAQVVSFYRDKGKEVPIQFMLPPYIEKWKFSNRNALLAVTSVPSTHKIHGHTPFYIDLQANISYYLIGAVNRSDNGIITKQTKAIRELAKEASKHPEDFKRISIKDEKNNTYSTTYISKFRTNLAWVYSGRLTVHKDKQGNPITRPLKDILNDTEKGLINEGKYPFTIVVKKRSTVPIFIGNQNIKNEDIVDLNVRRDREINTATDRAGTVWILHREADGKYYHKSVKVQRFDSEYLQNNESNYYIEGIKEAAEMLRTAKEKGTILEALSSLRDYLYFPNSNLFVKDSILYISKGGLSLEVDLNDASAQDIMEAIAKFNFKFTFNGSVNLKDIVDSNILITDLELLGNVGASAIIQGIEKVNGNWVTTESASLNNWKNEELIHTGKVTQHAVRGHVRDSEGNLYFREVDKNGNITFFKLVLNKGLLKIENTEANSLLLTKLEFLYYKNLRYQNKEGVHVERFLNFGKKETKFSIYQMKIPVQGMEDNILYFYADGVLLDGKAIKIVTKLKNKFRQKAIKVNKEEDIEEIQDIIDDLKDKFQDYFEYQHSELNEDTSLKKRHYSTIKALQKIVKSDKKLSFKLILELLSKTAGDNGTLKESTVVKYLTDVLDFTGNKYIALEDLFSEEEYKHVEALINFLDLNNIIEEYLEEEIDFDDIVNKVLEDFKDKEFSEEELQIIIASTSYVPVEEDDETGYVEDDDSDTDDYDEDLDDSEDEDDNEDEYLDEDEDSEDSESDENPELATTKTPSAGNPGKYNISQNTVTVNLNNLEYELINDFIDNLDFDNFDVAKLFELLKLEGSPSVNEIIEAVESMYKNNNPTLLSIEDFLKDISNKCRG